MQEQATGADSRKLVKTKERGIYRRGNSYVVRYRAHGRERKRFARTLAEARAIKAAVKTDIDRGEYREVSRLTFPEYAAQWLENYGGRTSRGLRPTTLAGYRRLLEDEERGAIAYFGSMRLAAITPVDVKGYARTVGEKVKGTSTVRNYLTPLKAMLADAFEDGLIRTNPAARVRVPARVEFVEEVEGEGHIRALTQEQVSALIAATDPAYRLLVHFLVATGLRVGEAVALRWSDIDFGRQLVRVRRRFYRDTFAPPKSRYGRRDVPLPPGLARDLWDLRKGATGDDALVFPGRDGRPLAQSSTYRAIQAAGKKVGVKAGNHTLRHTCATLLFKAGANAKQVQLWLGHHSPAFTLATYVHLLPGDLPGAAFFDDLVADSQAPHASSESCEEGKRRVSGSPGG